MPYLENNCKKILHPAHCTLHSILYTLQPVTGSYYCLSPGTLLIITWTIRAGILHGPTYPRKEKEHQ